MAVENAYDRAVTDAYNNTMGAKKTVKNIQSFSRTFYRHNFSSSARRVIILYLLTFITN